MSEGSRVSPGNPLIDCGKPPFFQVDNIGDVGLTPPPIRLGEAIRVCVRNLAGMQKEALVVSARTGAMWRLASDEGAYLAGLDEAPCPLSFFSTGMVSSYLNEILALASQRGIALDHIRLVLDNYYTMRGSVLKGTMVGGVRNIHLTAQIASAASREMLAALVIDATTASPLNGLMRGSDEARALRRTRLLQSCPRCGSNRATVVQLPAGPRCQSLPGHAWHRAGDAARSAWH